MPTYPQDGATGPAGPPLRPGPAADRSGPGDPPPDSPPRRGGPFDPATGTGAEPGERPLDDCLADYWQGAFTLRDASDEPAATAAHAGLGPSGITVRGRDLATLLDRAYRAFSS